MQFLSLLSLFNFCIEDLTCQRFRSAEEKKSEFRDLQFQLFYGGFESQKVWFYTISQSSVLGVLTLHWC